MSGFLLQISSLTKSFPQGAGRPERPVLDGIDLQVRSGESVAIVGPSGCGKSTLLNIVGGLLEPSGGQVLFGGKDIAEMGAAERARYRNRDIGVVFQAHHLLPQCTALENVLVPTLVSGIELRHGALDRAKRLLDAVGLADRAGQRPASLSGGECQRVAVARALINGPRLVLADEPTGSLDEVAAEQVADLLLQLVADKEAALLTVTHSMHIADRMQRTVRLERGRVVEGASSAGSAGA